MPVARITGQGLLMIALSVAALWGCIVGERITVRKAHQEQVLVFRDLYRLRESVRGPQPAALPAPRPSRPGRVIAG
jgi:hypothetical protein